MGGGISNQKWNTKKKRWEGIMNRTKKACIKCGKPFYGDPINCIAMIVQKI